MINLLPQRARKINANTFNSAIYVFTLAVELGLNIDPDYV